MTTNNTARNLPKLPKLPKLTANNTCDCGCGGRTGSRFVPGHDSKLKGMRIRVERGLWAEIEGFDAADPEPEHLIAQLDALAEAFGESFAHAVAKEMRMEWTEASKRKTA